MWECVGMGGAAVLFHLENHLSSSCPQAGEGVGMHYVFASKTMWRKGWPFRLKIHLQTVFSAILRAPFYGERKEHM